MKSSFLSIVALCLICALPTWAQTAATPPDPKTPDYTSPDPMTPVITSFESEASRRNDPQWAKFASNGGTIAFLAAGTLLPLVSDKKDGAQQAIRTVDALLVSTITAEALKNITNEKRLDGTDNKSFPSGHATAAFTVAAMQAHYHPKQALLWYAGATVIGASRVKLDRHYTHDVIAGVALGYFSAQLELKQGRGLILRPFVRPQATGNRTAGLSISGTF